MGNKIKIKRKMEMREIFEMFRYKERDYETYDNRSSFVFDIDKELENEILLNYIFDECSCLELDEQNLLYNIRSSYLPFAKFCLFIYFLGNEDNPENFIKYTNSLYFKSINGKIKKIDSVFLLANNISADGKDMIKRLVLEYIFFRDNDLCPYDNDNHELFEMKYAV